MGSNKLWECQQGGLQEEKRFTPSFRKTIHPSFFRQYVSFYKNKIDPFLKREKTYQFQDKTHSLKEDITSCFSFFFSSKRKSTNINSNQVHIQPEKLWRPDIMVIMVMIMVMVVVLEARYYGKSISLKPDMIFVKTFTRPEFLGPRFYTETRKSE